MMQTIGCLALYNVGGIQAPRSIARVHYEGRFPNNLLIVVIGMVGNDQHAVVLAEVFSGVHVIFRL